MMLPALLFERIKCLAHTEANYHCLKMLKGYASHDAIGFSHLLKA